MSADDYNVILNGLVNTSFSPKLQRTPSPAAAPDGISGDTKPVPLSMKCVGLMVMQARAR